MENFGQKCKGLSIDLRAGSNNEATPPTYPLPRSLLRSFRHIVVFLLCALLAVNEQSVDENVMSSAKEEVDENLRDSEDALLRMIEHAEANLDQLGDESIRTADTLLGLIVENALQISCREQVMTPEGKDSPQFDLEYIYSRYTGERVRHSLFLHRKAAEIGNSLRRPRTQLVPASMKTSVSLEKRLKSLKRSYSTKRPFSSTYARSVKAQSKNSINVLTVELKRISRS